MTNRSVFNLFLFFKSSPLQLAVGALQGGPESTRRVFIMTSSNVDR